VRLLGIDVGGTGIKGAPVDVVAGELASERYRVLTPQPSVPNAVAEAVAEVARRFDWKGPIGCTFPAVVKAGVALTAANVDESWIGTNGQTLFQRSTGCPVLLLNDADAAGIAEMRFGAGQGEDGVVILLTFGTGIGSAVFYRGVLVPNTEFGHLRFRGRDAEDRCSDAARQRANLNWEQWADLVSAYLARLEVLFSPDLFIIGGGISKRNDRFMPLLKARARVVPAQLLNDAGIVGAAVAAETLLTQAPVEEPA